jgi:hypothetical protein
MQCGKVFGGIDALNLGTLPVYVGFDPGHHFNVSIIVREGVPEWIPHRLLFEVDRERCRDHR